MFESDEASQKFLKEQKALWTNTHKLADMLPRAGEFDAIFYVGGHGRELPSISTSLLFFSQLCLHDNIHLYQIKSNDPIAMFDLTEDPTSLALIQTFAAANKPVAAVCHGPCVLLNATAPSGVPLISGVGVTGFSNAEEDAVSLSAAMPFMLETELGRVSGGKYVKAAEPWGEMVVVGKAAGTGSTIITGQNPGSATGVGKEILKALGL